MGNCKCTGDDATTAVTIPQLDGANQESSEEEESDDSEEEDDMINQVRMCVCVYTETVVNMKNERRVAEFPHPYTVDSR